MNAICLVIDRLHVGHIGAYGNAWAETPSFDALACESFVFDQALTTGSRIETLYQNLWQGRHPLLVESDQAPAADLARRLAVSGVATTLLTDTSTVADHPGAASFDNLVEFDPLERIEPADEVEQTHLARCFAQLIDRLGSAEGPFLFWAHLSSMDTCWDAPYAFRERFAEPGDPAPPRSAEAPRVALPKDYDPDVLLGMVQSYAGQVSLLDVCLGALLESIDEGPLAEDTLLAVFSARGFPLGEHDHVGPGEESLHGELVHVPMMVRLPKGLGAAQRSQALVTPADLRATLLEWWSVDNPLASSMDKSLLPIIRGDVAAVRDRLVLGQPDLEKAVRTPAWYMRLTDPPHLYVKPDDRWEVNNVADRCESVVEELQEIVDDFQTCLDSDRIDDMKPISDVLRDGLE